MSRQRSLSRLSLEQLQARASAGESEAMYELGKRHYAAGGGGMALAGQWWARAAGLGHGLAMFHLGALYARGEGVRQDAATARHWWSQAAAKGVARAIHNMAVLDDVARDEEASGRACPPPTPPTGGAEGAGHV